ncbi:MAG TPA: ATP-binding protein [Trebonia sp.]|nr:ATP-binding protein [Trebonia sp.]
MTGEKERPASLPGAAAPPVSLPFAQEFNAGSLYALRSAVGAHAAAAGLGRHRVYDVTTAAHELAANAVRHGAGHGSLRLWAQGAYLCCAVADDGPAENGDGPAAPGGRARATDGAAWPVVHGHGLWIVGEIADDVRVDRGHAGTIITARFAIHPDGDGR